MHMLAILSGHFYDKFTINMQIEQRNTLLYRHFDDFSFFFPDKIVASCNYFIVKRVIGAL